MKHLDKAGLPFIVVSIFRLNRRDYAPEVFGKHIRPESLDDWFDMKGVFSVVKEVAEEFRGREKFFMTGFSAGGAVTWYVTIYHPERLAASAPACGGFGMRSSPGEKLATEAPERETLPIRIFQGVQDKLALRELAGDAEPGHERPGGHDLDGGRFVEIDGRERVHAIDVPGVEG